jgi:tetratricopeptide (TPR) repeat protein
MMRLAKAFLLAVSSGCMLFAQTANTPANPPSASDDKSSAYYHFAMGRYYAGMAALEGNRNDYVSKAIQHYRDALKADPTAGIIFEELTDLYVQTGRLQDAVNQAEDVLKQNPDSLDARRMLGRIYVRAAGDNQTGKVNETYLRKALDQYEKITEKDPKDAESWVMLGRLYRVSNKSPEAEKAFNNALAADPDSEDAITQLAVLYAELGDSKRAIEKLKAATSKSPNERTLSLLADQYEQLNDFKSAAEALKQAYDLAPDNPRIARNLAVDLMYSDQFDDALKIFEHLASEDPKDYSSPLNMSKIYVAKHDFAKAREAWNRAKAIDAQQPEVRMQEVKLLEAEGKNDQAMTVLKALLDDTARRSYSEGEGRRRAAMLEEYGILARNAEKYPQALDAFRQMGSLGGDAAPRSAVQIIDTYRQSKDYDSALREAEAALKKYPDDRMLKVEHATVLSDQGKTEAAAKEIRSLLTGERGDYQTYLNLAQIYEKAKRYADMGKALDEAGKLASSNDENETVHFMRGAMYERMKKYEQSEAEFRKVLDINPDNSGALNYLGYMLADRNVRLDEAHDLVKKALELDPDNGAYLDSMAWVYYREGKYTDAAGLLERALERIGKDPTVHDHLGDVYLKMGKTREAITQWQASLNAFHTGAASDSDPDEIAKVTKKLDEARVRLAQEMKKK